MSQLVTSRRRLDDPENRKDCVGELDRASGPQGSASALLDWVTLWGDAIREQLLDSDTGEEGFEA